MPTFVDLLAVIIGLIASVLLAIVPAFESVVATQLGVPMAITLLHSSLDSACIDRTNPALIVTPAALSLQPVGTLFTASGFCTTLRRVSNTSDSGGFETHEYSQLQAFSSDNVYLLLDGSNGFVVRRVSDLSLVTGLDTSGWHAPRWYPAQPHVVIHFDSNDDTVIRLQSTNVDTLVTTDVFTFPVQYERIRVPQSWDELSEDGHWLAGMASRNDGAQVIFALDLQNLALGAQLPIPDLYAGPCEPDPEWGEVEPDWVGVSPLGNYLVVQWCAMAPPAAVAWKPLTSGPAPSSVASTTATSTVTWASSPTASPSFS
jgi:hypothetical protein